MILGILALGLAYLFYIKDKNLPYLIANKASILYKISRNKWYIDELYQKLFVNNIKKISQFYAAIIDMKILDNLIIDGIARKCKILSNKVSALQTGFVYHYFAIMFMGIIFIFGYFLLKIFGL